MGITIQRWGAWGLLCAVLLTGACARNQATPQSVPAFDPTFSQWNRTLAACVVEGQGVNYAALAAKPDGLEQTGQMLARLSGEQFNALDSSGQMAVLINAHNLLALKIITQNWPVKSIEQTRLLGSALRVRGVRTAGRSWSLLELRKAVMGDPYFEPRAIFLLNWAQAGCAPLPAQAVTAANLKDLLELQTRRVFADERYCRYDRRAMTIWLTPLVEDYRGQFERDWATLWGLLDAYMLQPLAHSASRRPPQLRWMSFSTALNATDKSAVPALTAPPVDELPTPDPQP